MPKQGATIRNTAQKNAVRQALAEAPGFLAAQDLHRRLHADGHRVGLATVYRQLNALATEGEADIVTKAGERLFRTCSQPDHHHHHLICETCSDAVEVAPSDEDWVSQIAADHGYAITRHTVEIYGYCPRCRSA